MATAVRNARATAYRRQTSYDGRDRYRNNTRYNSEAYVYGNTARALRPIEEEIKSPRKLSHKTRKNIDRDTSMNPAFMLFLVLAMVVTGLACVQYIRLQTSVTGYVDKISALEIQLEEKKAENDDYESRIKGAIGLESIKKRAMDDLGMAYASDDQIVVYESEGTDYVRQFVSIE